MKFCVVLFDPPAFFGRSPRGAYAKSQVPQGAGEFGDERTVFLLRLVAFKKKKDVQVGIRKEQPPSVAPQRDQAESLRYGGVHVQHIAKDLLDVPVRQGAQSAQRISRARAGFKLPPDSMSLVFALRAEHGQRRRRT